MSNSVVGALRVNLGLDSAQFSKGLSRAQSDLNRARTNFLAVAGAAAAFGAALATAALKGAQDIDKAAKASRRLGASVAGYRALEMAADDAGVSLSSLANDVQTMNRELARAEIGEGRAGDALERMGLAAADFAGLDADERVAVLADRVKELGLSSGETTLLLRDLGVRNREMALLVMQGGDALRRARQDVNEFGLALSDVDASRIEAANDEISGLADITTYIGDQLALKFVPAMGEMARAMTDSLRTGGLLRTAIDALIGSLDRIGVYIGVVVTWFGARYIAALAAARLATMTLAGALATLRVALVRVGFGVLIVAAGEMVLWFSRLVTATGDWATALSMLGDVAGAVWQGIIDSSAAIPPALNAVWASMQAGFFNALASMAGRFYEFVSSIAGGFEGVPGLGGIGESLRGLAVEAGVAASELGIAGDSAEAAAAGGFSRAGQIISGAFGPAREAVERLRGSMNQSTADMTGAGVAAEDLAGDLGAVEESAGGGGGGGAAGALRNLGSAAADAAEAGMQRLNRGLDSISDAMADAILSGKNMGDALGRVFQQIATDLLSSGIRDLLGSMFSGAFGGGGKTGGGGFLSRLFSFDGGGFTGSGARTGGLDGKGGFLAMMHPRETVIDHTKGGQGGMSAIRVELGDGLVGSILSEAQGQTVQILQGYDRQLPARVNAIAGDRRKR